MIIYSVEICVTKEVFKSWYNWMSKKHIPDIMRTNLFIEFEFYKKFENNVHKIYVIQYALKSFEQYKKYQKKYQKKYFCRI